MIADKRTLEALDFPAIREGVVARTATERGRAYAQELLPFSDFARIRCEQAATAAARDLLNTADLIISRAVETNEMTQRAAIGTTLPALDLRAIGDALAAAAAAHAKTHGSEPLAHLTVSYRPLRELQRAIDEAIDDRGSVLDRASPALARIRRSLQHAQSDARDKMTALLRSAKFAQAIQDNVVTIREGRFVIPVKAEYAGQVPGIVHDTSSSGQTLFVEPLAALEINNRVRTLRIEEEREVARILEDLSRRTGKEAEQIESNVEMLAQIDLVVAKAQIAQTMDACSPDLVDEAFLQIVNGRHPLLGERAIPQSFTLNEDTLLLVISGPNMGGKTVTLKMAGLFVLMLYAGMQIPAAQGTGVGRFDLVCADIGDEQSIAQNASTFSAHLQRMREIITNATDRTLFLVDEIGGGTEPSSGAALAVAMLEQLLRSRAHGIVSTHATELKLFAHEAEAVENASVRFDPKSFVPTYQLDVGAPGQSLAFPLARALGIPPDVVERSESLLGSRERDYERALSQLSNLNAELQIRKDDLERERLHLERLQANLRSRTEALERERRSLAEGAEARLQQALREFVAALEEMRHDRSEKSRPKVTRGQAELLDRTLAEMHRDLGLHSGRPAPQLRPSGSVRDDEGSVAEQRRGPLSPGDRVRILSYDQEGVVLSDNGGSVLVAMGSLKTVVPKDDVRRIATQRSLKDSHAGDVALAAASQTTPELDVRGKRFVEAEPIVEGWIDQALIAGNSPLRLIHGKGTGLLGRGLQEYLRSHPHVESVRYGNEDEGGGGVTIFELR